MPSRDALQKEALQLPFRDRAWLAEALDESLNDAALTSEIDLRLDAFAKGGHAFDEDESLEQVRQMLAAHRGDRGTR